MPSIKNKKIQQNATTSKESENVVVEPEEIIERPKNIYEKIYDIAGKVAATSLGQYGIEKLDRMLTIVEKTAKWSLPPKETDEDKGIRAPVLERPCSWIPFLSLIVALRIVRVGLSFGSILIGNRPVSPSNMIYFIQSRRRKLRAIKYHGLRVIRLKKQKQANQKRHGVLGKLTSIFNMVICRPGLTYEPESEIIDPKTIHKNKKLKTNEENHITPYKESLNSNEITISQKHSLEKGDDVVNSESDEDLPVDKLLDKYGDKTSDIDDPDFVAETLSDGSVSISNDSDLSDDEDFEQKLNELKRKEDDIRKNINENTKVTEATTSTLQENVDNDKENEKEITSEKIVHSETQEVTTSVTINPTRMSPKIAQNGNADDEKFENFYDTVECVSDDTDKKGSPNFRENKIAVNQNYSVKKIIEKRENSSIQIDKPITTDTNNENINDNHVQASHSHQQTTNTNQTKQHNNKKYYNNNSNHNTFKYTKGRKIH